MHAGIGMNQERALKGDRTRPALLRSVLILILNTRRRAVQATVVAVAVNLCILSRSSIDPVHALLFRSNNGYHDNKSAMSEERLSFGRTLLRLENGCTCELLSTECLDAVKCLPIGTITDEAISTGVLLRMALVESSKFDTDFRVGYIENWIPIGMGAQKVAVDSWLKWRRSHGTLPKGVNQDEYLFIDDQKYPYCVEHGLVGKSYFLTDFDKREEFGSIETESMHRISGNTVLAEKSEAKAKMLLQSLQAEEVMPYDYLLGFSHIYKIAFNLRPFLQNIYRSRVHTIPMGGNEEPQSTSHNALRVSLHVRRGDACDHKKKGYHKVASALDSEAQTSGGKRLCYDTSVYLDALTRVHDLAKGREIVVYLATDFAGSLLDEMKTTHGSVFKKFTWKYLAFDRDIFNYAKEGEHVYIEAQENNKNKADMGETAALDLWHLSHGQVFVGNLGSRFGKSAWFLAMSRNNMFVPYFSVDGRSPCCDIDENCGQMAPFISSMENCLTFSVTSVDMKESANYWKAGSSKRKEAVTTEQVHYSEVLAKYYAGKLGLERFNE